MRDEEWCDIDGYEGVYQASSLGRIRSLDRYVNGPHGSRVIRRGRIMKLGRNTGTGYLGVVLCVNGKHSSHDVHRIIAETFIPTPRNLPCVDHINCDRHDNRVENLRWVTQLENIRHGIEVGNIDLRKKAEVLQSNAVRKARFEAVRRPVVRSDGKQFDSVTHAAEATGCSRRAITLVLSGTNKSCKGFAFEYLDKKVS